MLSGVIGTERKPKTSRKNPNNSSGQGATVADLRAVLKSGRTADNDTGSDSDEEIEASLIFRPSLFHQRASLDAFLSILPAINDLRTMDENCQTYATNRC